MNFRFVLSDFRGTLLPPETAKTLGILPEFGLKAPSGVTIGCPLILKDTLLKLKTDWTHFTRKTSSDIDTEFTEWLPFNDLSLGLDVSFNQNKFQRLYTNNSESAISLMTEELSGQKFMVYALDGARHILAIPITSPEGIDVLIDDDYLQMLHKKQISLLDWMSRQTLYTWDQEKLCTPISFSEAVNRKILPNASECIES